MTERCIETPGFPPALSSHRAPGALILLCMPLMLPPSPTPCLRPECPPCTARPSCLPPSPPPPGCHRPAERPLLPYAPHADCHAQVQLLQRLPGLHAHRAGRGARGHTGREGGQGVGVGGCPHHTGRDIQAGRGDRGGEGGGCPHHTGRGARDIEAGRGDRGGEGGRCPHHTGRGARGHAGREGEGGRALTTQEGGLGDLQGRKEWGPHYS